MRHQPDWGEVLAAFDANEARILALEPAEPMPEAEFCRQSPHRTLGHLTACQVAWLPLMRKIRDEAPRGNVAVHPLRLFEQLGYATMPWPDLMRRFSEDRREWRLLLAEVDLERPLKLPARVHTAKSLTEKLVRHELGHLDDLEAQGAVNPTAQGNALGRGGSREPCRGDIPPANKAQAQQFCWLTPAAPAYLGVRDSKQNNPHCPKMKTDVKMKMKMKTASAQPEPEVGGGKKHEAILEKAPSFLPCCRLRPCPRGT